MVVDYSSVIYENSLPQLRSRVSLFPFACEMKDGTLMAVTSIGEAFESVDLSSFAHFSHDRGKTWSAPVKMYRKDTVPFPHSDFCKPTALPNGKVVVLGYSFDRSDPQKPIGNPENGGLLDDFIYYSVSDHEGKNWSDIREIPCSWGHHAEASAPLTVLSDGSWATPITGFPDWNGNHHGSVCGRLLRSYDEGKTWNDDVICMTFPQNNVSCYEQRICQLDSGAIVCIAWNEDLLTGKRMNNHYSVSFDNGMSFSEPMDTGMMGQASSVCAIGGDRILALHAVRRDTERPGIYARIIDFSHRTWKVEDEKVIWEPNFPIKKSENMAEIFSFLKFGQPGAILLSDGKVLMTHWFASDGLYRTVSTLLSL